MSRLDDHVTLRGHRVPVGAYLDGRWTTTDAAFAVINPSDADPLAEVAECGPAEALRGLDAAAASQEAWRSVPPRQRAELFHHAHSLMLERVDAFTDVMVLESGKPRAEAEGEFGLSAGFFRWYAEQIAHLHGTYSDATTGGYRVVTTHQPVGPSFLVTPWNFPLLMAARKAGAALAAGCTVLMKSAKETPLTAALFTQVLHDAGFPAGVVNLVHTTDSAAVSEAVLPDPRLRKISFTGSTGVGSTLLSAAARNIVNSSMELGGDGPFVVLDDADIEHAVEQAVACKFRNAGQACVAANRIILHRDIAEEFTERFVERAEALRVGDGFDGVDVGPIITQSQLERVGALVTRFVEAGAEVLTGGRELDAKGFFYEPTVLRVSGRGGEFCNEELFAPVAALYTVDSAEEAVDFANDTRYGLASYVFTRDLNAAFAISERLDFGMVGINRGIMADPAAAFGGIKESGLGREGGHEGIYEFLEPKYLAITVDEKRVMNR
ncbi:NAD-dependent succinate-semialdehyde dehydrogenase [Saccharopolyspora sp. TS4A08]|uniref:NAD-dependent succinate-semialdehyde dehydrogenase n=1 Tax=Saccharopolyspora ipomoeae TaxID=3042027 RepID=A0ABT6PQJ8_9PSEU|nr:NAD-dependent succinate-semialdehyde dehydrogenase [Saccharopolyspora sp. TS4A08]MDI2030187.1 NAD-dependent succinate-semialdehyde dehydrogenase [Saccharopolyspora sp. TS4A08]